MNKDLIKQEPSTISSSVNWFICLITGVSKFSKENHRFYDDYGEGERGNEYGKDCMDNNNNNNNGVNRETQGVKSTVKIKKQPEVKRTIVLATPQPTKVLFLMNSGEDDNIVFAAEKAINSKRLTEITITEEKGLRKRFEFVCMLGPVTDRLLAHQILAGWEKYRGSISRTTVAASIAVQFNIKFSINWDILLETKYYGRRVEVLSSDISGKTLLYIYNKNEKKKAEKKEKMEREEIGEYHIRPIIKKQPPN
jgi:hypothetical protein